MNEIFLPKTFLNKLQFANELELNSQDNLTANTNSPADWRDVLCRDRACRERFDREGRTYWPNTAGVAALERTAPALDARRCPRLASDTSVSVTVYLLRVL